MQLSLPKIWRRSDNKILAFDEKCYSKITRDGTVSEGNERATLQKCTARKKSTRGGNTEKLIRCGMNEN